MVPSHVVRSLPDQAAFALYVLSPVEGWPLAISYLELLLLHWGQVAARMVAFTLFQMCLALPVFCSVVSGVLLPIRGPYLLWPLKTESCLTL
jgi:hypothetical protein